MSLNLDFNDGELFEYSEKCNAILDWAEDNRSHNFDASFIESVLEQIDGWGRITEKQKASIDNIITKFEIDF